MSNTVLITGANGRLGQAALNAFASRGWSVRTLVRRSAGTAKTSVVEIIGDVRDYQSFHAAAVGCDVIVHAANPSYEHWEADLPVTTRTLIDVASAANATIVMAGNIYPYGDSMPPLLKANTPPQPSCEHGRLRAQLEADLQKAAVERGVQTLLVRSGNYIDGRDTGNWFESHMCRDVAKGKFMYPGVTDALCEWVYLPDVGGVMAQVAAIRSELQMYEDIGLPGFAVTGVELHGAVEAAVGKQLKLSSMPWVLVKLLGLVLPKMKAVHELRYLFNVPHRIDGTRLNQILPQWRATSMEDTMSSVFRVREKAVGVAGTPVTSG